MVTVFNKPISNETHIMTGATSENPGTAGLAPAPAIGDQTKVLTGAGVWGLPGVVTINGRAPNPVTGDIVVIEGGGSSSYGSYRLDATITPSDWVASNGAYVAVVSNQYITSGMDGSETWLDNEYAQLGDAEFVSDTGTLTITTTVQPTENWNLHASLAVNGADVLADVSAIRTSITEITTNLGSPSSASGVTGADAFSKIASLNGKFSPTLMSTDANNAITSGLYYLTGDCANRPADWCIMTVVAYDNDTLSQTATSVITGKTYVRAKSVNGWTSWEELALNSNLNIITSRVDIPATNVESGTFVTLATISVNNPGPYLIEADVAFGSGDGIRILLVDPAETDNNNAANSVLATGRATLQKIRLFVLTPSDRIYIRAYQNTGSSLSVGGSYQILRLR